LAASCYLFGQFRLHRTGIARRIQERSLPNLIHPSRVRSRFLQTEELLTNGALKTKEWCGFTRSSHQHPLSGRYVSENKVRNSQNLSLLIIYVILSRRTPEDGS
jgi:hypothetical protein